MINFKDLPNTNEKFSDKNIERAIESNKNNDFLIAIASRLADK